MTDVAEQGWVERTWTSPDGLVLSARDYAGAGGPARLPVVCLHGLTRNARDFEATAPWIAAQGRRVLALDVRGRGRSGYASDPATYTPAYYAQDVAALLTALGLSRAVFVGTSMGGLITMVLAATAPQLVAAAVLNDIGPQLSPVGLGRIASYTGKGADVADWEQAAQYARELNQIAFPHYGDEDWRGFARRLFRDTPGGPVLDYDPAIARPIQAAPSTPVPDLWPLFDQLVADARPVLLIRGELSDLVDADGAAAMRARAPAMTYAEVSGVGHAPMLTEREAREALAAFLRRQL